MTAFKKHSMISTFLLVFVASIPSLVSALKLTVEHLVSPPGPKHSNRILTIPFNVPEDQSMGLMFFANNIVVPNTGGFNSTQPMGTDTGYCVEVWKGKQLACYASARITMNSRRKGTFVVEALFDLTDFPSAVLTITGGTGDFLGMIGSGKTINSTDVDGTTSTIIMEFDYEIARCRRCD
jgi:hypothetical protein